MSLADQCDEGARRLVQIVARANDPMGPHIGSLLLEAGMDPNGSEFFVLFAGVCSLLALLKTAVQTNPGTTPDEFLMALLSGMLAGIPR